MSKEKLIEQGEKFLKLGKYDRAIKEFEKLLSEDPTDMRTKLKIADICVKKKDISSALKLYQEVADQYAENSFHLKAIAIYKTILKLAPTVVEVNKKLGDLYHKVGLDQDAMNQYYIVATYYDGKGVAKEAMEVRQKIVAIDPFNTTGRIRLAELMQAEGKTEDSLHEYERAAEIMAQKKDREGLIEVYEKMLYFKPDNPEMLVKLCQIYFEKREFKRALRRLEAAPSEVKKNLEVNELWAEALLEDRQVDASRKKFKELYEMSLEAQEAWRAARLYSRILREFSDDRDYLKELEEIQKNVGVKHETRVVPHYRQDFERTEMIDLNKDPAKKK